MLAPGKKSTQTFDDIQTLHEFLYLRRMPEPSRDEAYKKTIAEGQALFVQAEKMYAAISKKTAAENRVDQPVLELLHQAARKGSILAICMLSKVSLTGEGGLSAMYYHHIAENLEKTDFPTDKAAVDLFWQTKLGAESEPRNLYLIAIYQKKKLQLAKDPYLIFYAGIHQAHLIAEDTKMNISYRFDAANKQTLEQFKQLAKTNSALFNRLLNLEEFEKVWPEIKVWLDPEVAAKITVNRQLVLNEGLDEHLLDKISAMVSTYLNAEDKNIETTIAAAKRLQDDKIAAEENKGYKSANDSEAHLREAHVLMMSYVNNAKDIKMMDAMNKWLNIMAKHLIMLANANNSFIKKFTRTATEAKNAENLAAFSTEIQNTKASLKKLKADVAEGKSDAINNVATTFTRLATLAGCPVEIKREMTALCQGIQMNFQKKSPGTKLSARQ